MKMILLKPDSAEWNYLWTWLENHPINEGIENPSVAENPLNGEKWQYIGSFRQDAKVIHELRHKCFPTTGERVIFKVHASEHICGEDIEKEFSIDS